MLDDPKIILCDSTRFLGITLSSSINWEEHKTLKYPQMFDTDMVGR